MLERDNRLTLSAGGLNSPVKPSVDVFLGAGLDICIADIAPSWDGTYCVDHLLMISIQFLLYQMAASYFLGIQMKTTPS